MKLAVPQKLLELLNKNVGQPVKHALDSGNPALLFKLLQKNPKLANTQFHEERREVLGGTRRDWHSPLRYAIEKCGSDQVAALLVAGAKIKPADCQAVIDRLWRDINRWPATGVEGERQREQDQETRKMVTLLTVSGASWDQPVLTGAGQGRVPMRNELIRALGSDVAIALGASPAFTPGAATERVLGRAAP